MPTKQKIYVKWHPQYKPSATKKIITGYRVYAYIDHPLYPIKGSEHIVKTKYQAQKLATQMRKKYN